MRLLSFYFVITACFGFTANAEELPRRVTVFDVRHEGRLCTAISIRALSPYLSNSGFFDFRNMRDINVLGLARPFGSNPGPSNHLYEIKKGSYKDTNKVAVRLLEAAKAWLIQYYDDRGMLEKDYDGSMRRRLLESKKITDPRNKIILVTEHNPLRDLESYSPAKIVGMLGVFTSTSNEDLVPAETSVVGTGHEGRFPRLEEKTETKDQPVMMLSQSNDPSIERNLNFTTTRNKWGYFATAEVQHFAAIDLIDPLIDIALSEGFFTESLHPLPPGMVMQENLAEITPTGLLMWPGEGPHFARIGQLVLETDGEERRRAFRLRGFREFRSFENENLPGNTTFWMQADIESFLNRNFRARHPWAARMKNSQLCEGSFKGGASISLQFSNVTDDSGNEFVFTRR